MTSRPGSDPTEANARSVPLTRREGAVAGAVVILTIYALMIGGTTAGTTVLLLRLTTIGVCALAFAAWAVAMLRDPGWRPRSVLLPVLILALASMGVSAFFSTNQRVSVESLAWAIVLAALYLLLVQLLAREYLRVRLIAAVALLGFMVPLLYVGAVAVKWVDFWNVVGRITAPPLSPAAVSVIYGNQALVCIMSVLLGACLVGWSQTLGRRGTSVGIVGGVVAGAAVLLSGERAGWLGIAVATLVVGGMVLARHGGRRQVVAARRWVLGDRRRLLLPTGLIVSALVTGALLLPGVLRRLASGGEEVRLTIYAQAWRTFLSAPLVGVGPGMWALDRLSFTLPLESDRYVPHAHDIYLQGLAEMGVLGGLVGLLGLWTVLWLLRDGLASGSTTRRRWAWLGCFSLAYVLVHEALDFHLNIPAVLIVAALPIAVLDADVRRRPVFAVGRRFIPTRVNLLPVAALPVALVFLMWVELVGLGAGHAVALANSGYWAEAAPVAAEAATSDPDMPAYTQIAGLAAAHAGDDVAAQRWLTIFANQSQLPEAWLDVAALRLGHGDEAGARTALAAAARLGNGRPAVAVPIFDLATRLGDRELAVAAAASAIWARPSLAADPWWMADPGRAQLFPSIVQAAIALTGPGRQWEISLMAGDSDAARRDAADASDPGLAMDVIAAWGGDREASQRVDERCDRNPLNGPLTWCVRIASRLGDAPAAARYTRLAALVYIDPETLGELRVSLAPTLPTTAGLSAYIYPSQVFRRPGVWDILVPGLPHLVVE